MPVKAYNLPMFRNNAEKEEYIRKNADKFLAVRGTFKRSQRETQEFSDYDAAVAHAEENPGNRPWMIYGVMDCGTDVHLRNVK